MSENKSCADFMALYASDYVNCFTCRWWNMSDFACLNPEEMAKRRKENEFNSTDRMIRGNKPVQGPL